MNFHLASLAKRCSWICCFGFFVWMQNFRPRPRSEPRFGGGVKVEHKLWKVEFFILLKYTCVGVLRRTMSVFFHVGYVGLQQKPYVLIHVRFVELMI